MASALTRDPETAMSSSVMIPTQATALSWPYSVWTGRGVMWKPELLLVPRWLTSHTTHVVSLEPVMRKDPHWSRATHVTRSANIHINIRCTTHASKISIRGQSPLCKYLCYMTSKTSQLEGYIDKVTTLSTQNTISYRISSLMGEFNTNTVQGWPKFMKRWFVMKDSPLTKTQQVITVTMAVNIPPLAQEDD